MLVALGTAMISVPPGASSVAAWLSARDGWRRCSSECQKMTADQVPSTSSTSTARMCGCGSDAYGSQADGLTPVAHERLHQGPVARAHVENRAGRQNPVQPVGQGRASAADHLVAQAGEPARRGAVPDRVGLAQLLIARPGRRRRDTAAGAAYPAGKILVGVVELMIAPGAADGGRRLGTRIGLGVVADSERAAFALGADYR